MRANVVELLHHTGKTPVPAARAVDLITTETGDEMLVYDTARHHIHHLNRTAAIVWRLCDGRRSVQEIANQTCLALDTDVDEGVVREAVAQLSAAQLLEGPPATIVTGDPRTRRRLSRRRAVAAGAAVVISMTAPTAAAAQSPQSSVCTPACPVCRTCVDVDQNSVGQCAYMCTGGCSCPDGSQCISDGLCHRLGGCFVAGTRVAMADGTSRPIELVAPGDEVLGRDGVNRVLDIVRPALGDRPLFALNDGAPFVTGGHPFLTVAGWKAIDPAATLAEVPGLPVGKLTVGDRLLALAGAAVMVGAGPVGSAAPAARIDPVALTRVTAHAADPDTLLFNLRVDGDHTYAANDLIVHNKLF